MAKHLIGATATKTSLGVGVPQTQQMDARQVKNAGGGYVFALDPWLALDRFLILGTTGGTYYASEQKHTADAVQMLGALIAQDGKRVVERVRLISVAGRAPRQDNLIFTLAACAGLGDKETRAFALTHLNAVCRTGSMLLEFVAYVEGNKFRGWGRALRSAINNWYEAKGPRDVAYQVTKYANRNGFTHNDLLRLAHIGGKSYEGQNADVYRYIKTGIITEGTDKFCDDPEVNSLLTAIANAARPDFPKAKRASHIVEHRLVREVLPTEWLSDPNVWEALLDEMPMTAMVRNLAKMTVVGLLTPRSEGEEAVLARLGDQNHIRKGRIHPIALLAASGVYAQGHGVRGSLAWVPAPKVVEALDEAFYLAFGNVEPTGKRLVLALDWSGSMMHEVNGMPGLTCRKVGAALALVHAATEPKGVRIVGYTKQVYDAPFVAGQRLTDVMAYIEQTCKPENTDCAQPILHAAAHNWPVDAFIWLTDNETWAGDIHVHDALDRYRKDNGLATKAVGIAMTATEHQMFRPDDANALNVVGCDTATPSLVSDFIRSGFGA